MPTTGEELWAYVPRITMKKLYVQASTTYGTNHQFTTDGSPEVADVKIGGAWRTVLVAGLNAGGRGYYALDVTDPADPKRCGSCAPTRRVQRRSTTTPTSACPSAIRSSAPGRMPTASTGWCS
jgi:Tfp pilus tip-associated adhesin PilY1